MLKTNYESLEIFRCCILIDASELSSTIESKTDEHNGMGQFDRYQANLLVFSESQKAMVSQINQPLIISKLSSRGLEKLIQSILQRGRMKMKMGVFTYMKIDR